MGNYVAGVDLGGTKIYTALADDRGRLVAETVVPTRAAEGPGAVIARIVSTIREVQGTVSGAAHHPAALGVGSPGPLDPVTGVVHDSPNLGWHNVPLKKILEDMIGIPVLVDNDANLAALGEYRFGAGCGARHMVYVTVSTGIGGGLIIDGRVYRGAGGGAGELGHMVLDPDGPLCGCGRRGCLETLASGTAIASRARELVAAGGGEAIFREAGGSSGEITAITVAAAARSGDPEAAGIIKMAGIYLGMGLAGVVNLLNPDTLVLGGGAFKAGRLFWDSMSGELSARALPSSLDKVRVVAAGLGGRSGLMGAVALALEAESGVFPDNTGA